MEPRMIRCANGKWLAVSPEDRQWAPIGLGVIGCSENDARQRFFAECRSWADLLNPPARDLSEPPPVPIV